MKIPILIFLCLSISSCSVFYVAKQATYQLKLLAGAEPIAEVLRDSGLGKKERHKLELVLAVRQYAQATLGLRVKEIYQNVNLSFNERIYAVTACPPLSFKPYEWWFLIIGSVPYKGYFKKEDALAEEARLKTQGLETMVRPVGGYSTLGYFSDPVWRSMLNMRDHALVELIIHELVHATVYFPGQTKFNESFANFVAAEAAARFVVEHFGADSAELIDMKRSIEFSLQHESFFHGLYLRLQTIYTSSASDEEKLKEKARVMREGHDEYGKILAKYNLPNNDWDEINNAYLISFQQYNNDDKVFSKLFNFMGRDLPKFMAEVAYLAHSSEPFKALNERVNQIAKYHENESKK
jgi:predicted aminopeptidase